jgi:hypothetical protein
MSPVKQIEDKSWCWKYRFQARNAVAVVLAVVLETVVSLLCIV